MNEIMRKPVDVSRAQAQRNFVQRAVHTQRHRLGISGRVGLCDDGRRRVARPACLEDGVFEQRVALVDGFGPVRRVDLCEELPMLFAGLPAQVKPHVRQRASGIVVPQDLVAAIQRGGVRAAVSHTADAFLRAPCGRLKNGDGALLLVVGHAVPIAPRIPCGEPLTGIPHQRYLPPRISVIVMHRASRHRIGCPLAWLDAVASVPFRHGVPASIQRLTLDSRL
ncbi:hypothetical protein [Pandoraea sputorum]|uniref:hypothetical protein n=1 Tax=Pandoraea sputorum TaxID=93222 RepID=UPI00178546D6|nr:hypothetical protein [Pandoraea sputorum]